ncbi:MAG TPA: hypothetical protein VMS12_11490 [Thermoanaerobaculia bacterium]|nr:hypothetical protein [Thermoanaerobaculia bacterium]
MLIPSLIFAIAAAAPCSQTLTLRTGHEIVACGPVQTAGSQTIFNGEDGKLYSLPSDEIAEIRVGSSVDADPSGASGDLAGANRPLSVSETEKARLLAHLARSRGVPRAAPPPLPGPPPSDREIDVSGASDERFWRERSRAVDERVRQAREELDLLLRRERKLESELLGLRALGFKDHQFSYQILQLQFTRDSKDRARLEIVRAEREQFQFREDARKEGILPGWLR